MAIEIGRYKRPAIAIGILLLGATIPFGRELEGHKPKEQFVVEHSNRTQGGLVFGGGVSFKFAPGTMMENALYKGQCLINWKKSTNDFETKRTFGSYNVFFKKKNSRNGKKAF